VFAGMVIVTSLKNQLKGNRKMKERTTRKDVNYFNDIVIQTGYCTLQNLLARRASVLYTAGVYGWNADVYRAYFDGKAVAIVTGYRPFGSVRPSYQLCKFYDDKAAEILKTDDYNSQFVALENLIVDFIGDALKEAENRKTHR
jgi:hypothetical protein